MPGANNKDEDHLFQIIWITKNGASSNPSVVAWIVFWSLPSVVNHCFAKTSLYGELSDYSYQCYADLSLG